MAAGIHLPGNNETIDLQQQVADYRRCSRPRDRCTPPFAKRQCSGSVLRIVVRELEMAGATFPGTGLSYGEMPESGTDAATG